MTLEPMDSRACPTEIAALHDRCGVYTRPQAVGWFLDKLKWTEDADLRDARLLEPAAGNGVFLEEAARRLVRSYAKHGCALRAGELADKICAFELHPGEAAKAGERVVEVLRSEGARANTANALARKWLSSGDFLRAELPMRGFTHIVGNPPYVRWSRIPSTLRTAYEAARPSRAAKGDLLLAFLERSLKLLSDDGRLGFLCSDRWFYAEYGEDFRANVLPSYVIESRRKVRESDVFEDRVDAYPIRLVMRRRGRDRKVTTRAMSGSGDTVAKRRYEEWCSRHPLLEEAGCRVRVGPALGCTAAFVGTREELDVEEELLAHYVSASEVERDSIAWQNRFVTCMNTDSGPIDLSCNPKLRQHLMRYRDALSRRAIVKAGRPWHRPIDRVLGSAWSPPKILIPEMCKTPRVAVDCSGAIPAHGVYAIFSDEWPIDALATVLRAGLLWTTLQAIAPTRKSGHLRAYARFLRRIPLPKWSDIPLLQQSNLTLGIITKNDVMDLLERNVS